MENRSYPDNHGIRLSDTVLQNYIKILLNGKEGSISNEKSEEKWKVYLQNKIKTLNLVNCINNCIVSI